MILTKFSVAGTRYVSEPFAVQVASLTVSPILELELLTCVPVEAVGAAVVERVKVCGLVSVQIAVCVQATSPLIVV